MDSEKREARSERREVRGEKREASAGSGKSTSAEEMIGRDGEKGKYWSQPSRRYETLGLVFLCNGQGPLVWGDIKNK
jgi:hypothetical protein